MATKSLKPKLVKRDSVAEFAREFSWENLGTLKEYFDDIDQDKDGQITLPELSVLLKEWTFATDAEIETLFNELDQNGDKKISFQEFVHGLQWMQKSMWLQSQEPAQEHSPSLPPKSEQSQKKRPDSLKRSASIANFLNSLKEEQIKEIRELFKLCDTDGDGVITKEELSKLMADLGVETTKADFEVFFKNLDINDDGKIEFDEFLSGMRWLQKGLKVANAAASIQKNKQKDSVEPDQSLREKNVALTNYLKELISKIITQAQESLKNKHARTADTLLRLLDVEELAQMENIVGPLANKELIQTYQTVKKQLATTKKKK
jgi:Ca2+-binding EF-hand superfamily protein